MLPDHIDAAIELIHRVVGYPLAFVVAPWALATFAGARGHPWAGKTYVALMTFLYLTGTAMTLTRHSWFTWEFGRNVVFNLLGYSMLLYGFRAMWLMKHPEAPRPARLDRVLLALLVATVSGVTLLATVQNTPLRVFAAIGIALVVLEIRDWRGGLAGPALYRRHIRYMLGSYFYVLTVVSLVHFQDELPRDVRWLWPSALGLAVIWIVSGGWIPRVGFSRAASTRWAMRTTLAVATAFGVYAGWELIRDARRPGPAEAAAPEFVRVQPPVEHRGTRFPLE